MQRFWYQNSKSEWSRLSSSLILTLSIFAVLSSGLLFAVSSEDNKPTRLEVPGGRIDVYAFREQSAVTHEDLINWVNAAARSVVAYLGRYPVAYVEVRITIRDGKGIRDGRTFGSPVPLIKISIGRETSVADLRDDWTMTHEMVHLSFPSVDDSHHWIEEGIATYVEPIARVQAGILQPSKMWSDVVRDLPQGLPQPGDGGLDVTHTWGRTYWGGALFCLLADVKIHQQTRNQKGLEDALRGILAAGGNITEHWPLQRALRAGDEATGTEVLEHLYEEMKDKPVTVDLEKLWSELGIQRSQEGISFTDDAPLTSVRKSMTQRDSK
ncbi:MAG: hypothetical protein WB919_03125 [Candidatus Sulfotelmatobacter sp.]